MSVNLAEVEAFTDKRVTVQYNSDADADGTREVIEQDGTLMAAQPGIGIMFRPKGQNQGVLVDEANVLDIVLAPTPPKKVRQKKLKEISTSDARQHLADRHGTSLEWVNTATPEQALEYHGTLNHEDLGHTHVSENAESTEQAEVVSDGDADGE